MLKRTLKRGGNCLRALLALLLLAILGHVDHGRKRHVGDSKKALCGVV